MPERKGFEVIKVNRLRNPEADPIWQRMVDMATKRGITVYLANQICEKVIGFYCKLEDRQYIAIDWNLTGEKLRYVMAHELGHAVLHEGKADWLYYYKNRYYRKQVEQEANAFAERLLRWLERRGKLETADQRNHSGRTA